MSGSRGALASRTQSRVLRVAGPAMLVVGIFAVVVALSMAERGDSDDLRVSGNPAIEALIPAPGTEVIRQVEIGIDLASGYEAELTINGTPIPQDQLNILRDIEDPRASAASQGTFGTTLNRFTYQPLEGRIIPELLGDRHCVVAVYWPLAEPDDRESVEWCFRSS